ncbi:MAG TPA: bifunctional heptose 7-phosphate kinase/heptose 1-phosphate adenyltransferase [Phycisphaerales bacterium]|nr:bifunctional heptose 7-phosphate kinase/heptose 1-phosphate adenyltransferase [Phycisphaerales bacterium]
MLLNHLAQWKPFTTLVVGDFMLDQLVYGDAERLTADAPVPVLQVRKTDQNPGGAANVALDLVALRGNVHAFGVIGNDGEGRLLSDGLGAAGIATDGLIVDSSRPTTVKRSLIGLAQHRHPQKMFRVDYESREPIPDRVIDEMLRRFDLALPGADTVAIEDYGKGVCTPALCQAIIDRCRRAGKEVLVDPACISDYSKYRGATAITPNRTEAETAAGLETHQDNDAAHNAQLARALLESCDLAAVILTLDRHGALLLERNGKPVPIPTLARQVYDVTGAGDMVLAALLAARANRIDWPEAVRFANAAAGLEVEVFGCKPIPFEQVYRHIFESNFSTDSKRRTLDDLVHDVATRRALGQSVVFTNGCFDVIHAGHIHLFEQARREGDFLIVATNSDESITKLKGPGRPHHHEEDRVAVLCALACVDAVLVFGEDSPEALIKKLRPDVLVKGAEYDTDRIVGADLVLASGGRVVRATMKPGRSTTRILAGMRSPQAAPIGVAPQQKAAPAATTSAATQR